MDDQFPKLDQLLHALSERAKELNCLYNIEEILKDYERELDDVLRDVLEAVPQGWQYPEACRCRITCDDRVLQSEDFTETAWSLSADIRAQETAVGGIEVFYNCELPEAESGPFLDDEVRLIQSIAERLSSFIQHQRMSRLLHKLEQVREEKQSLRPAEWEIVVELLERTDESLYFRIARKLLNLMCRSGVPGADELIQKLGADRNPEEIAGFEGENIPRHRTPDLDLRELSREIFRLAGARILNAEILGHIQHWMQEDRASFLLKAVSDPDSNLGEIIEAVRRFVHLAPQMVELSDFTRKGIRVALIRRIISEDLNYIRIAKEYAHIDDFYPLVQRLIHPTGSHGKLGGKSAGLFLAANIIRKHEDSVPGLKGIRVPKTWYITSDALLEFMHYNNLEEVTEQKYKEVSQIRQEYPHVIQLFKNSQFPPEMIRGISMALDDFGDRPLVVRSSSLLEDRFGAAFSGKYKSLFLANQGSKTERLNALLDAVAEVYSSTFGPDPIEYRAERGLLDFHEEMCVMIQEVVGRRVGDRYYLPAYAGVAFSNNEFRWSQRIRREDGLIRFVPGLGTRAVDRLSDDYPVLVAPGQPGLRVNLSPDEVVRYSPSKIDVINLKENRFETIDLRGFLAVCGHELPGIDRMLSLVEDDHVRKPPLTGVDFEKDPIVVTFRALIDETPFVKQVHAILNVLQETMKTPVDIEFASDGEHFYLLQCRPQSAAPGALPAPIPRDLPESAYLFSANRYVSNGQVPDITHVVYVDPEAYAKLENLPDLRDAGRAVSALNKLLPKRQFILMGPGRWGSRGDIKLGVNVTYSDINNTAVLIEIARRTGNYLPDLSFGTHFFQDLVEASIRYLPLYPDEEGIHFNERFLTASDSILEDLVPEYARLKKVVRVIDVPRATDGKILKVLMNAELCEAVGVLTVPSGEPSAETETRPDQEAAVSDEHWRWRLAMTERIAANLHPAAFAVKALYVIGSTKNGTAGPASDIDLLIHFTGTDEQKEALQLWLKGWSLALDEMNYLRTGYRSHGLLDVHLITDDDIEKRTSYAAKIGAVTDPARELPLGSDGSAPDST